mmetsp:Transcript_30943/g.80281  ORF Transcript_30943/g.80281 Transcript_30943/m.80281 type:complete len:272 (+) Transcript_30943:508-1323(+)
MLRCGDRGQQPGVHGGQDFLFACCNSRGHSGHTLLEGLGDGADRLQSGVQVGSINFPSCLLLQDLQLPPLVLHHGLQRTQRVLDSTDPSSSHPIPSLKSSLHHLQFGAEAHLGHGLQAAQVVQVPAKRCTLGLQVLLAGTTRQRLLHSRCTLLRSIYRCGEAIAASTEGGHKTCKTFLLPSSCVHHCLHMLQAFPSRGDLLGQALEIAHRNDTFHPCFQTSQIFRCRSRRRGGEEVGDSLGNGLVVLAHALQCCLLLLRRNAQGGAKLGND